MNYRLLVIYVFTFGMGSASTTSQVIEHNSKQEADANYARLKAASDRFVVTRLYEI